jgi:hypothetical protein
MPPKPLARKHTWWYASRWGRYVRVADPFGTEAEEDQTVR